MGVFFVILSSAMLLGGVLGFVLDNSLPGSLKERGFSERLAPELLSNETEQSYDLPFPTNFKFSRYIPFLPAYSPNNQRESPGNASKIVMGKDNPVFSTK